MEAVEKYNNNNGTGLVSYEMTPDDVMKQVQAIQNLMTKAMKDGDHYGKIPGCGDKPTLLKAGAEKLTFMFRLAPKYEVQERDLGKGHREYRIITELIHIPTGKSFGQGVGICSTMETKYRFRNAAMKCPECNGEFIIKGKAEYGGGWLCFKKKGGCGAKFDENDERIVNQEAGKIEYENPSDHYNTVLKMAKKRSLVDATLTSTAASDIFTQDVEELVENGVIDAQYTEIKDEPKQKKEPAKQGRNYTAEAEACTTLEQLGEWWNKLTPKEKKNLDGLKNHVKEKLQADKKDVLQMMITALSKETYERDHKAIEKLIDDKPVGKREFYADLYFGQLDSLGVQTDYEPLPF